MLDRPNDPILNDIAEPERRRPSIDDNLAEDLKAQDLVLIEGRPFRFLNKPKHQPHQFYDEERGEILPLWTTEIYALIADNKFLRPGRSPGGEPSFDETKPSDRKLGEERAQRLRRVYGAFSAKVRKKAEAKFLYVSRFMNEMKLAPVDQKFSRNKTNATKVIKEVDGEIDDWNRAQTDANKLVVKPKRSVASLLRWVKRDLSMQIQEASLVHRNAVRQHERKIAQMVLDIIAAKIREMVKVSHKFGATKVRGAVLEAVKDYNLKHGTNLEAPKLTTIQNEFRRYDAWIRLAKEKSPDQADLEFGAVGKLQRPKRILDLVELDHHKFDLHGIFGKTPLGNAISNTGLDRFWVCLALDVHSGYPVGFAITFEPGGLLPALMCIDHAVRVKSYVKTRWPHIDGELLGYGKPVRYRYDNAKEFVSLKIQNALARIGVGFQLAIPGQPQSKPYVERHFGTIERDFVHWLKGTTYANVIEKGKRNPVADAVIPWDDFQMLFHQYLIECYARRQQRDLDWETPEERWTRGAQSISHRPRPLTNYEQERWDIINSIEVPVKARREGFLWQNLWFNSPELQEIRRRAGDFGTRTRRATALIARIPLLDISRAYVADPTTRGKDNKPSEIVVPALNPHVKERTIWQHDAVCNYLNRKRKGKRERDPLNPDDYLWGFMRLFRNALAIMGVSREGQPPKKGKLSGGQAPRIASVFLAGPAEHALKLTEEIILRYDFLEVVAETVRQAAGNEATATSGRRQNAAEMDAVVEIMTRDPIIHDPQDFPEEDSPPLASEDPKE